MNFTETVATTKNRVLQELRRKRKWQTYVVALGLTLCFFLVVGNVLGESSIEPEAVVEVEASEELKPFKLSDSRSEDQASAWEVSTGSQAPPRSAESLRAESVPSPETLRTETPKASSQVIKIAADSARNLELFRPENSMTDIDKAGEIAKLFYSSLNDGNLGEAYDGLSPEFQAELPFKRFTDGYSTVESNTCEIKNSEQTSPEQIRLDLQIEAYENGEDSTYYATCILCKADDAWTIAGVAQLPAH